MIHKRKKHVHFLAALLHISKIIDDNYIESGKFIKQFFKLQVPFCDQQLLVFPRYYC